MSILKKFFEFLEEPKVQNEIEMDQKSNSSQELKDALKKLSEEGGEIEWNQYRISVPSELNSPEELEGNEDGAKNITYLIANKDGKHAQAKSEEEVEQVVSEQILFESFRQRQRRKRRN